MTMTCLASGTRLRLSSTGRCQFAAPRSGCGGQGSVASRISIELPVGPGDAEYFGADVGTSGRTLFGERMRLAQ